MIRHTVIGAVLAIGMMGALQSSPAGESDHPPAKRINDKITDTKAFDKEVARLHTRLQRLIKERSRFVQERIARLEAAGRHDEASKMRTKAEQRAKELLGRLQFGQVPRAAAGEHDFDVARRGAERSERGVKKRVEVRKRSADREHEAIREHMEQMLVPVPERDEDRVIIRRHIERQPSTDRTTANTMCEALALLHEACKNDCAGKLHQALAKHLRHAPEAPRPPKAPRPPRPDVRKHESHDNHEVFEWVERNPEHNVEVEVHVVPGGDDPHALHEQLMKMHKVHGGDVNIALELLHEGHDEHAQHDMFFFKSDDDDDVVEGDDDDDDEKLCEEMRGLREEVQQLRKLVESIARHIEEFTGSL